ncbi:type II secretion system protein GspH [Pseudoxanthomonas kalamensis DSM 18571]|uniref:type II secretion system protein XpsH n=1 Tax=Pseudoxanthomonas kalamensis TaxID=289483 RepID=UPI0013919625|nr:GspH/FimT family pseudopilin [Pseudoxanthomonas kalamensis]KAF1708874.1 type II secretion system protein GspH [Pseudoxanthomonas kalamensis DSM 18571]
MTKRRARGFTLLEILLVLGLIAVAGTLAALAFSGGLQGMQLRSEARQVAAQLRHTRAQAIASGQPQRFVIDPMRHQWQAPGERSGRISASLAVGFYGAREAQPHAGAGGVLFFPDGASTGGRVRLQAGRSAIDIDIGWLTGEVKMARVDAEAAR